MQMRSFDLSFWRHFRHVYFLRITSGMENRDAFRTQSASMFTEDFTRGLAHQDQKPGVRGAAAERTSSGSSRLHRRKKVQGRFTAFWGRWHPRPHTLRGVRKSTRAYINVEVCGTSVVITQGVRTRTSALCLEKSPVLIARCLGNRCWLLADVGTPGLRRDYRRPWLRVGLSASRTRFVISI